jgi:hypothetical protein
MIEDIPAALLVAVFGMQFQGWTTTREAIDECRWCCGAKRGIGKIRLQQETRTSWARDGMSGYSEKLASAICLTGSSILESSTLFLFIRGQVLSELRICRMMK